MLKVLAIQLFQIDISPENISNVLRAHNQHAAERMLLLTIKRPVGRNIVHIVKLLK